MRFIPPIIKSIALLLAVLGSLGIVFFSLPKVDRALDIKSVEICGEISKFAQTTGEESNVEYPVQDIYSSCLSTLSTKLD